MGFFGLSTVGESDMAWDFWANVMDAKGNEAKIKKLIAKELRDHANCWNTPGFMNIALYLKSEGKKHNAPEYECPTTFVISDLITQTQYKTIKSYLQDSLKEWGKEHRSAIKSMLKCVESKQGNNL